MDEAGKYMKMPRRCTGPKNLSTNVGTWGKRYLGGHDLVRRVDRQFEVLIWCRKCSAHARQRMGQTLMNCCKMLEGIRILEDGRVPAKEAQNWKIEGKKRRITWKEFWKTVKGV